METYARAVNGYHRCLLVTLVPVILSKRTIWITLLLFYVLYIVRQFMPFSFKIHQYLWNFPNFKTEKNLWIFDKQAGLPWGLNFNAHTHPIPTEKPVGIPTESPYPQNPEILHTRTLYSLCIFVCCIYHFIFCHVCHLYVVS